MANKACLFCTVAGVLFYNGQMLQAEEPNEELTYQMESPQKQKPESEKTLSERLQSAILRWNEAIIDGNEENIANCQKKVFSLLADDVKSLEKQVKELEAASVSAKQDSRSAKAIDRTEEVHFRELLHEKKLLLSSIKNSDTFGNTYRLLGDYLYLLRQDEVPALAGTADSCSYMDSLK